jgi:hypothetical protein
MTANNVFKHPLFFTQSPARRMNFLALRELGDIISIWVETDPVVGRVPFLGGMP